MHSLHLCSFDQRFWIYKLLCIDKITLKNNPFVKLIMITDSSFSLSRSSTCARSTLWSILCLQLILSATGFCKSSNSSGCFFQIVLYHRYLQKCYLGTTLSDFVCTQNSKVPLKHSYLQNSNYDATLADFENLINIFQQGSLQRWHFGCNIHEHRKEESVLQYVVGFSCDLWN